MSETDYIDDNEDEELPAGAEGDDADEAGPADEEDAPAAAGAEGEAPAKKPSRKDRQAERVNGYKALQAELAEQRRQNAEMARQIAASVDATRRVAEGFQQSQQPKPKPFAERAAERLLEAQANVDPARPETLRAYNRLQAELIEEAAEERAERKVRESEARLRQNQPRAELPEQRRQREAASWLFESPGVYNQAHVGPIWHRANTIAAKHGMDLERTPGNSPTRQRVIDQAIAEYAAWAGLETNLQRKASANPGAVAGAGSRSFAGAAPGGATPAMDEQTRRIIDQHPEFSKIKNPEKRYAAGYKELIAPEMRKR